MKCVLWRIPSRQSLVSHHCTIVGGMRGGSDPWKLLLARQQRAPPITEVSLCTALHKLSDRGA